MLILCLVTPYTWSIVKLIYIEVSQFFIKSKFLIPSISTIEVKSFEHLEIHIVNPYDIILSVIYRPPNNSCVSFQENYATYITHLAQYTTKLSLLNTYLHGILIWTF